MQELGRLGDVELDEIATELRHQPDGQRQVGRSEALGQLEAHRGLAAVAPTERVGRARGDHPAGRNDDHRVGERLCLVHVVGGEHDRPALRTEPADHLPRVAAGRGIEAGRRLVEKDELGVPDESEPQVEPPLLTAREVLHPRPGLLLEAHQLDDLRDIPRTRVQAGSLGEHLGHRQVRLDRAFLEDDPDLGAQAPIAPLGVHPEHRDRARVARAVTLQDLDGRRLAGTVRAEQGDHLTARHFEVDAAESRDAPVGLGEVLHHDREVAPSRHFGERIGGITAW